MILAASALAVVMGDDAPSSVDEEAVVAMIGAVQKGVYKVEGFKIRFLHPNGRDVRDDKMQIPGYPFKRMMKNNANVRAWTDGRFTSTYPGFNVAVLNSNGKKAHGNTKLSTVRDTYLDD